MLIRLWTIPIYLSGNFDSSGLGKEISKKFKLKLNRINPFRKINKSYLNRFGLNCKLVLDIV